MRKRERGDVREREREGGVKRERGVQRGRRYCELGPFSGPDPGPNVIKKSFFFRVNWTAKS